MPSGIAFFISPKSLKNIFYSTTLFQNTIICFKTRLNNIYYKFVSIFGEIQNSFREFWISKS